MKYDRRSQKLNQTIDRLKDVNLFQQLFWQILPERRELQVLHEHYARSDRMRSRILKVET